MKVRELVKILQALDQDKDIYIAIASDETSGRPYIEEVTESCEDDTVVGYVITDQQEVH